MTLALFSQITGKGKWGNFFAQWVPTWLIMAYNKLVKLEGHDQTNRGLLTVIFRAFPRRPLVTEIVITPNTNEVLWVAGRKSRRAETANYLLYIQITYKSPWLD